mmetsp:Transcript_3476/g.10668  ORF Transcript_3476/g.10668 Transcript_3476/m.10668 type:complete len:249 (+) Transcript_3476:907-1653(+)
MAINKLQCSSTSRRMSCRATPAKPCLSSCRRRLKACSITTMDKSSLCIPDRGNMTTRVSIINMVLPCRGSSGSMPHLTRRKVASRRTSRRARRPTRPRHGLEESICCMRLRRLEGHLMLPDVLFVAVARDAELLPCAPAMRETFFLIDTVPVRTGSSWHTSAVFSRCASMHPPPHTGEPFLGWARWSAEACPGLPSAFHLSHPSAFLSFQRPLFLQPFLSLPLHFCRLFPTCRLLPALSARRTLCRYV